MAVSLICRPMRRASEAAIAAWSGGDEARRFRDFCKTTRQLYATLEGPMIRAQRPSMGGFMGDLGFKGLGVLAQLGPMRSLWQQLGHQFTDPRLRQLFARYATYCGSSPWQSPATLMLIAQVEMDGVWSVEGGMVGMAQALARVARRRGAVFRYTAAASALSSAKAACVVCTCSRVNFCQPTALFLMAMPPLCAKACWAMTCAALCQQTHRHAPCRP